VCCYFLYPFRSTSRWNSGNKGFSFFFTWWCNSCNSDVGGALMGQSVLWYKDLNNKALCSGDSVDSARCWGSSWAGLSSAEWRPRSASSIYTSWEGGGVAAHLLCVTGGSTFIGWVRLHEMQQVRIIWLSCGVSCRDALCSFLMLCWWVIVFVSHIMMQLWCWECSAVPLGEMCFDQVTYTWGVALCTFV
jgi:hypothetical protein